MGGHNPDYGGRECSLGVRWVLVGCSLVARWQGSSRARPAASRECCEGPSPSRSPSRSPSQSAPLGQSGGRPWGRAFLCGGPPLPAPPAPPSPYMCPYVCVGVQVCVGGGVHRFSFVGGRSVSVFGAPRSSSVLRALARMPDAARCAPPPASGRHCRARVVSGCALGATWRAVGPSALNGPARAPRAPSRLL